MSDAATNHATPANSDVNPLQSASVSDSSASAQSLRSVTKALNSTSSDISAMDGQSSLMAIESANSAVAAPTNSSATTLQLADLLKIKQLWESLLASLPPAGAVLSTATSVPPELLSSVSASLTQLCSDRVGMTAVLLRDSGLGKVLTTLKSRVRDAELSSKIQTLLQFWKTAAEKWKLSSNVPAASRPTSSQMSAMATPAPDTPTKASPLSRQSSSDSTGSASRTPTAPPPAKAAPVSPAAPSLMAAAIAAVAPDALSRAASSGSDNILAESKKRKAEQKAALAEGGDRKRISLMGSATARPQVSIPYPIATAAPSAAPPAAAPVLPSSDAFFARASPAAASSGNGNSASVSASKRVLTPPLRTASSALGEDELRGRVRCTLCRALDPTASATQTEFTNQIADSAAEVEAVMFAMHHGDTGTNYRTKSRETAMSLRDPKNPTLRERVLNGAISAQDLLTYVQAQRNIRQSNGVLCDVQ
jgi:hypothetical protein